MVIKSDYKINKDIIKNLLSAQEQIAKVGNATENIKIAKYLFKASKKLRDQEEYIFSEICEYYADQPPDSSE